ICGFDLSLCQPSHVPQIPILDASSAHGECDQFVGEDFFTALCIDDEIACAQIDFVEVEQRSRHDLIAWYRADVEVDALCRHIPPLWPRIHAELPSVHFAVPDRFGFGHGYG